MLVACEYSGAVRDAFLAKGHNAMSCDLLDTEVDGPHYKGDVFDLLDRDHSFDLMICHPPCTYLTVSGFRLFQCNPERAAETEDALKFISRLLAANVPKIALENPVGCISSRIRKPDQIIQPYDFGEDASKKTCLWLKGLPRLQADPANRVAGRMVMHNGKLVERWENQTDSGQNRLAPSVDRWKDRSRTYPGIAAAMADAWS